MSLLRASSFPRALLAALRQPVLAASRIRRRNGRRHPGRANGHDALHLRERRGRQRQVGLQRPLRDELAAPDGPRQPRSRAAASPSSPATMARSNGPPRAGRSYYWAKDTKAGDKTGDGFNGVWKVAASRSQTPLPRRWAGLRTKAGFRTGFFYERKGPLLARAIGARAPYRLRCGLPCRLGGKAQSRPGAREVRRR